MTQIRAVFFDLGNVLVFHDDAVLFSRLSAWGGAPVDVIRERVLALWDAINRGQLAGDDLRRAVCRAAGSEIPMEPAAFLTLWNCHFRINEAILPHVENLLSRTRVFLLSNTNALHFEPLRKKLPILDRFAGLVLSYELGLAKPDRKIFEAACRKAEVDPEEAAFFDDVPAFTQAALATGMMGRVFGPLDRFIADLAELGLPL